MTYHCHDAMAASQECPPSAPRRQSLKVGSPGGDRAHLAVGLSPLEDLECKSENLERRADLLPRDGLWRCLWLRLPSAVDVSEIGIENSQTDHAPSMPPSSTLFSSNFTIPVHVIFPNWLAPRFQLGNLVFIPVGLGKIHSNFIPEYFLI